jgi:hypothetical protein
MLMVDEVHRYLFDYYLSCFFEDRTNKFEDVNNWSEAKREKFLKGAREGEKQWKECNKNRRQYGSSMDSWTPQHRYCSNAKW